MRIISGKTLLPPREIKLIKRLADVLTFIPQINNIQWLITVVYKLLDYCRLCTLYSVNENNLYFIWKREENFYLNNKQWKDSSRSRSRMCYSEQQQTICNWVGSCPILRRYGLAHFCTDVSKTQSVLPYLDGKDYRQLFYYVGDAVKYRSFLVDKFNFIYFFKTRMCHLFILSNPRPTTKLFYFVRIF